MTAVEFVNEDSLLIRFGHSIDTTFPHLIAKTSRVLNAYLRPYITDVIPSYTTLLIIIDTSLISRDEFAVLMREHLKLIDEGEAGGALDLSARKIEIPVLYDEQVAPDLRRMAEFRGVSIEDIIGIHSSSIYTVYAVGFLPGFAYLGSVDRSIAEPRLQTPRPKVFAGSVGIADEQTGVYPLDSPGGWNIIGRSPMPMLQLGEQGCLLCPLSVGDEVCFKPITQSEFDVFAMDA